MWILGLALGSGVVESFYKRRYEYDYDFVSEDERIDNRYYRLKERDRKRLNSLIEATRAEERFLAPSELLELRRELLRSLSLAYPFYARDETGKYEWMNSPDKIDEHDGRSGIEQDLRWVDFYIQAYQNRNAEDLVLSKRKAYLRDLRARRRAMERYGYALGWKN